MKRSGLLACACATALIVGCGGGNSPAENRIAANDTAAGGRDAVGTVGGNVSSGDRDFVSDQLADGMAEIETAKLAKAQASSPEVKAFAQMMIDDHTAAGGELKRVAATYAIAEPIQVDDQHRELMDKLARLNGAEFDKAYISAMVDDHEHAVNTLRSRVDENRTLSERLQGKNPGDPAAVKPEPADDQTTIRVNEWAANVLPTVERHLNRAKALDDDLDHANTTVRGTSGRSDAERIY